MKYERPKDSLSTQLLLASIPPSFLFCAKERNKIIPSQKPVFVNIDISEPLLSIGVTLSDVTHFQNDLSEAIF